MLIMNSGDLIFSGGVHCFCNNNINRRRQKRTLSLSCFFLILFSERFDFFFSSAPPIAAKRPGRMTADFNNSGVRTKSGETRLPTTGNHDKICFFLIEKRTRSPTKWPISILSRSPSIVGFTIGQPGTVNALSGYYARPVRKVPGFHF